MEKHILLTACLMAAGAQSQADIITSTINPATIATPGSSLELGTYSIALDGFPGFSNGAATADISVTARWTSFDTGSFRHGVMQFHQLLVSGVHLTNSVGTYGDDDYIRTQLRLQGLWAESTRQVQPGSHSNYANYQARWYEAPHPGYAVGDEYTDSLSRGGNVETYLASSIEHFVPAGGSGGDWWGASLPGGPSTTWHWFMVGFENRTTTPGGVRTQEEFAHGILGTGSIEVNHGSLQVLGGATTIINSLNSGFAVTSTATPEPSTFALLGLGAVGFFVRRRRMKE